MSAAQQQCLAIHAKSQLPNLSFQQKQPVTHVVPQALHEQQQNIFFFNNVFAPGKTGVNNRNTNIVYITWYLRGLCILLIMVESEGWECTCASIFRGHTTPEMYAAL